MKTDTFTDERIKNIALENVTILKILFKDFADKNSNHGEIKAINKNQNDELDKIIKKHLQNIEDLPLFTWFMKFNNFIVQTK